MRGRDRVPRCLQALLRGDPLLPADGAHHDRGEDKVDNMSRLTEVNSSQIMTDVRFFDCFITK